MIFAVSLYVVFFALWLFILRHRTGVSKYLVSIYLVSFVCGLMLFLFYYHTIDYPQRVTVEPVLFHILLLFLLLFPIINFSKSFCADKIIINARALNLYSWAIIIPSIIAVVLSFIDVLKILLFQDFLVARRAFLAGSISNLYTDNYGVFGYLPSFGPQISFLALFFFFYRYFYKSKHDLTSLLLFISSFAIVLNNLAIAGREGFVRWFLYLGFCWVVFNKNIPFKRYKTVYLWGLTSLTIIGSFFMAITSDRFEESDEGTAHSIILYAGQPSYNFSYRYWAFFNKDGSQIGTLFPLVSGAERDNYAAADATTDFRLNTFSTIAGSFLGSVGGITCLLIAIIWCVLMIVVFRHPPKGIGISLMVTYLFMYEIVMLGVLYYLHGNRFTQLSIVAYILLAFMLENGRKKVY